MNTSGDLVWMWGPFACFQTDVPRRARSYVALWLVPFMRRRVSVQLMVVVIHA